MSDISNNHSAAQKRFLRLLLILIGDLLLMTAGWTFPVRGQTQGFWSTPTGIYHTEGNLASTSMDLIAGPDGTLHLFFPHQPKVNARGAIDYVYWDGTTWSAPVSVLLDPLEGTPAAVRAALDAEHRLHLIWLGANGTLQYASAPLTDAGSAHGWTTPRVLSRATGEPDIIADAEGALYIGYIAWPSSGLVTLQRSTNAGRGWSTPVMIAAPTAPEVVPNDVRLARSADGTLHATWTEYALPDGWPPRASFYTRSTDNGDTWRDLRQIAGQAHGEVGVGTMGAEVHLVWRSTIGGAGTFHQYSIDHGTTWHAPRRAADGGGFSGLPGLVSDAGGDLHATIGSAFVMRWSDGAATPWIDVAGRRLRTGRNQPAYWTHPERAVIAVTQGNWLHVVFETGFRDLWHTSRRLDVLPEPTVALYTAENRNDVDDLSVTRTLEGPAIGKEGAATPPPFPTTVSSPTTHSHFGLLLSLSAAGVVTLIGLLARRRSR